MQADKTKRTMTTATATNDERRTTNKATTNDERRTTNKATTNDEQSNDERRTTNDERPTTNDERPTAITRRVITRFTSCNYTLFCGPHSYAVHHFRVKNCRTSTMCVITHSKRVITCNSTAFPTGRHPPAVPHSHSHSQSVSRNRFTSTSFVVRCSFVVVRRSFVVPSSFVVDDILRRPVMWSYWY